MELTETETETETETFPGGDHVGYYIITQNTTLKPKTKHIFWDPGWSIYITKGASTLLFL